MDPAVFFGEELRRIRLAAGFDSQDALGAATGYSRAVLGFAEQGYRQPTADVLEKWLDVCSVPAGEYHDLIMRLAVLAAHGEGPVPTWFEDWRDIEAEAHTLRIWQPIILPGLLQTEGYARALFEAEQPDSDKLDDMIKARLSRQSIFDRAEPPHTLVVLDEAVLHRPVGTAEVMAGALTHLAGLCDRSTVSIHVLQRAQTGLTGSFSIASVDGRADVVVMDAVQDQTTDARPVVRKAAIAFEHVRRDALPRLASRALVLEEAEKWTRH